MTQEIVRELIDGVWVTRPRDDSGGSQPGFVLPVVAATIDPSDQTNSPPSGAATLDGYAVQTGDRVLLIQQSVGADDGVWVVDTTGAWTRPTDWANGAVIPGATLLTVGSPGSVLYKSIWLLSDPITVGTDTPDFDILAGVNFIGIAAGADYLAILANALNLVSLPTSPGASGSLWRDAGAANVIKVVP